MNVYSPVMSNCALRVVYYVTHSTEEMEDDPKNVSHHQSIFIVNQYIYIPRHILMWNKYMLQ